MVIEIFNKEGRDRYKVGHENLIAAAGRSFGAKPVNTNSINIRKHHHNKFSAPNKQFLSTPIFRHRPPTHTHPTPDTDLTEHTSDTTRRFPAAGSYFHACRLRHAPFFPWKYRK